MSPPVTARGAIALVLFCLAPPAGAQSRPPIADSLRIRIDSVFTKWDRTDQPGCALGISRNGTVAYQQGYGMSNLEDGVAISPASIFHVASISKQFTAFAVGLLANEGRLSWDDDIHKFVPELPSYGAPITLRQLAEHVAGIRDQWELLGLAGWRYPADLITQADALRLIVKQKELNFPPGTEYLYSNSGYTLLTAVVERVTGQSLRQFTDSAMFKPLGMTQTHFHDQHDMLVPGRTQAYEEGPDGKWKVSLPTYDIVGATSLFTTVGDLLIWERNLDQPKVGTPELVRAMETPARLNDGSSTDYGLGLGIESYRGRRGVGHNGADAGYRTNVIRFPEVGLAVATLCNGGSINPSALTYGVLDLLLLRAATATAPASTKIDSVSISAAELAPLVGRYFNEDAGMLREFVVRNGGLTLVVGNDSLDMLPLPGNVFAVRSELSTRYSFPSGAHRTIRMVPGQTERTLTLVQPPNLTPAELDRYAGRYRSDELDVMYTVKRQDSVLVILPSRGDSALMSPAFADGFLVDAGTVRFTRDKKKNVDGFLVTTGRTRRVRFVKVGGG